VKTVATNEAKTHLSRYLEEASRGETIVITRGKKPVAKLVAYEDPDKKRPKVGETPDRRIKIPDEVWAPLSESELNAWGLR
jgi:prevent-host-death family protein